MNGLHSVFTIGAALCVIAALASLVRPATLDEIEKIEIEIEGQPVSKEEQLLQYPQTDRRMSKNFVPLPTQDDTIDSTSNIPKRSSDFAPGITGD